MDTVITSSSACTCAPLARRSDEVRHPLDPLTAAEIRAVVEIVRKNPQYAPIFISRRSNFWSPKNRSYVSIGLES